MMIKLKDILTEAAPQIRIRAGQKEAKAIINKLEKLSKE